MQLANYKFNIVNTQKYIIYQCLRSWVSSRPMSIIGRNVDIISYCDRYQHATCNHLNFWIRLYHTSSIAFQIGVLERKKKVILATICIWDLHQKLENPKNKYLGSFIKSLSKKPKKGPWGIMAYHLSERVHQKESCLPSYCLKMATINHFHVVKLLLVQQLKYFTI